MKIIWLVLLTLTSIVKIGDFDKALIPFAPELKISSSVLFKKGNNRSYKELDFRDDKWQKISIPNNWETQGFDGYDGIGWYRIKVTIPDTWKGHEITLDLGKIDDNDITYFNGEEIGRINGWDKYRIYKIPEYAVQFDKTNVIAIRVEDNGGNGGLYEGNLKLKIENEKNYSIYKK